MTTQNLFLDIASDQAGVLGLSSGIGEIMVDYVESALGASSRTRSFELERELVGLFHEALRRCPSGAVMAVQGAGEAEESTRAAYLMGQISFAQSLVSQNLAHKLCSEFKAAVLHELNLKYVQALYRSDLTNKQLVDVVGKVEESVSRRLKKLRSWGVTDCRKQGTSVINFLTPAARAIVESFEFEELSSPLVAKRELPKVVPTVANRMLAKKTDLLPSHMKTFSALGARKEAA